MDEMEESSPVDNVGNQSDEEDAASRESEAKSDLKLTEYDRIRKPWPVLETAITMNTKILGTELTCPICLDLLTNTMTTKDCLHRFCGDCITTALLRGNKECPTCRKKLVSKRSLRADPNFDDLIRKIWPDRQLHDRLVAEADKEETEKLQENKNAVNGDPTPTSSVDFEDNDNENDSPMPESRNDTPSEEAEVADELDEEGGRRTPLWFTIGDVNETELDETERRMLREAREAFDKLKKRERSARPVMENTVEIANDEYTSSITGSSSRETSGSPHSDGNDASKKEEGTGSGRSSAQPVYFGPSLPPQIIELAKRKDEEDLSGENVNSEQLKKYLERNARSGSATPPALVGITTQTPEILHVGDFQAMQMGQPVKIRYVENAAYVRRSNSPDSVSGSSGSDDSSMTSSDSSDEYDSEVSDVEDLPVDGEMDNDTMDELEMMDDMVHIDTSPPSSPLKGDAHSSLARPGAPRKHTFDPLVNDAPPYTDQQDQLAELNPHGKGTTWTVAPLPDPLNASAPLPGPSDMPVVNDEEEVVFDEDDVISACDIDDILQELQVEANGDGEGLDASKTLPRQDDEPVERKRTKYLCEETRMDLFELNQLRLGNYEDVRNLMEVNNEQVEMTEQINWYTQLRNGEELVYYEKCRAPQVRGKRKDCGEWNADEEINTVKKRLTFSDVMADMSDTDTDGCSTHSSSYRTSGASSALSVSSIDEEAPSASKEQPPDVPSSSNAGATKERLQKWLVDAPSHPLTPEDDLKKELHHDDDHHEESTEYLPDNYEIEVELKPTADMQKRNVPREVLQPRFIRAIHSTQMEHLSEYLYTRWIEEVFSRNQARCEDKTPAVPRPEVFYCFNRKERFTRVIWASDTLATAQLIMEPEDHVVIYFDTEKATYSSKEQSLTEKVVPSRELSELTASSSRSTSSSTSH